MALIDREVDDEAVLRAEDEAIIEAQRPKGEVEAIPTGESLARLIEDAINGRETPVQP